MTSLLAFLKARRRLIAPLIPLTVAGIGYWIDDRSLMTSSLVMAVVAVYVNAPARYFRYRPRGKQ